MLGKRVHTCGGRTCTHTHENMLMLRRIHPRYLEVVWTLVPPSTCAPPHTLSPTSSLYLRDGVRNAAALVGGALQKVAGVSPRRALPARHLWLSAVRNKPRLLVAHWLLGRVGKGKCKPPLPLCLLLNYFSIWGFVLFLVFFFLFYLQCSVKLTQCALRRLK